MAGIDHQPFIIGLVHQEFKELFPNPLATLLDKAAMRVAPPSIVRRQIAPGRARPQNPVMAETDVRYAVPLITRLKKWFIYDMIFNRERCRIAGGKQ